jgi:integrase
MTELDVNKVDSEMTFKDLYESFYTYQQDKVKYTTMKTYRDRKKFFEVLDNVKLNELTIHHFELWKKEIIKYNISTVYCNHIYKTLKAIMNYGTKWYDCDFKNVYNKMTNFTNPNELKKEMLYFTYEEFKRFISVEQDISFRCLYETLYYCGLRRGEIRGLQWIDIDFESRTLIVRRNITIGVNGKKYTIGTPKTKSSIRTIPIADCLIEDLKLLYEAKQKYEGFNDTWFVFGNIEPIAPSTMLDRKNMDCKLAGVKQIRIHDFRHSCASLLINNNANATIVAMFLGHTKIDETLNTYTHMFKNKLDEVVNLINKL